MSDKSSEASLTVKDRLNFPYLLANQILTFQRSILNLEFSAREIRESIEGFVHLIPVEWKDEEFNTDIENALIKQAIDIRPEFCGSTATLEFCKENGIEPYKYKETFDYYMMFQACINLLNRRGMLSKINPVQELEGFSFEIKNDEIRPKSLPRK